MSKALVIGGGIGGLSAAIGLRQAGIDVDVVEISPGREVYHVGIIVQANFMRALDRLGVADKAIARGFPYAGFDLCNKNGGLDAYIPGVALSREGHPTDLGLTRPALHDVLSDGCAAQGVTPRFGVTFEKLEQFNDKVTVTFTDGTIEDYDFVIGADGLFSKVRTELFGDKYTPTFTGQAVWRYNLPRPADVIRTAMYQGVSGGKAGYCPLNDETMYLLLVMAEPGKPWLAKEDLPRLFKERLAPFGGRIGEIRDSTEFDADQIVYRPLEAVFVSEPWYRGRILLIGDAAHGTTPHLGQGAAQAVEDAATLGAIAEENLPVSEMFARFLEKRYARCKFIWESSIQIGTWEMTNDPSADVEALSHKVLETVSAPL